MEPISCTWNYTEAMERAKSLSETANCTKMNKGEFRTTQFCTTFGDVLPYTYLGISVVSAVCCLLVFLTYFCMPRLRQTGYSSKIFLNRTVMDFVIALGHIVSGAAKLVNAGNDGGRRNACIVLGTINEFALMASDLWYIFLAVDLIRAIRNPFSSRPSYSLLSHLVIALISLFFTGILALLTVVEGPGGPGTSMFHWCWVQVDQGCNNHTFTIFAVVTFLLYYLWHFVFWIFSLLVIIGAGCILWGHLAASSETRKFVLKQNLIYVSVLGIETILILVFWLAQVAFTSHQQRIAGGLNGMAFFFTYTDLALAVLFAVVHSSRGAVDLFVWMWTFSIGPGDVSDFYKRSKLKLSTRRKDLQVTFTSSIDRNPLLTTSNRKDNLVNKALRHNAIYCINVGILDVVQLDFESSRRNRRVGSVRDSFTAAALMELDQENQRDEVAMLHNNPTYREQIVRKIRFPTSSSHLKEFSFIDLEPTVFSLLRESYGISPRAYRKSFEIKNASDIDSSLMLEKFTEGKSGSFFYFTQDYRFIIKTVTASEEKFLCKIAYEYYEHMKENKDSLIVRFFGLHKVRLAPEQRYITVVVMENIFVTSDKLTIHRRYDLKGSWVGRRSLKTGQSAEEYKGTLKDLDLGEEKICIGSDQKAALMELLQKDVMFLTKCHIMDYSLLLGIHQHGITGRYTTSSESTEFGEFPTDSRDMFQSPDKKSRSLHTRNNTVTSMSSDNDLHIPWFRQDNGGLQSTSTSIPSQLDFELSQISSGTVRSNRDSMVRVAKPPVTYFFGVVDILQQYTLRKQVEHLWKTRILRQDLHGLSAVNENEYGQRFLTFLDSIIE